MIPSWLLPSQVPVGPQRSRPHLEPLEERLPPGEAWDLLAWSWWGLDLASLGTGRGVPANRREAPPPGPASSTARLGAPEATGAISASARFLFAVDGDRAEPSGDTSTSETPGVVRGRKDVSLGSLRDGGAAFLADAAASDSWDGTTGDRPFRPVISLESFAHATPAGAEASPTTAPGASIPPVPTGPSRAGAAATAPQAFNLRPLADSTSTLILSGRHVPGQPGQPPGPPPPGGKLTLIGYSLGQPTLDQNSFGDTWGPAWSLDGQVYTASDDSGGFDSAFPNEYNIVSNRLTGDPNMGTLHGVSLAGLSAYGPLTEGCSLTDGCDNWKATNMTSVNGVLYLGVTITSYVDQGSLQPQRNASIIKSDNSDGLGLGYTWTPSHTYTNDPTTMWPDTPVFSAPYFVDYGQDPGLAGNPSWPDGADQYVYAVSTDAAVRNASNLYLGRVPRDQIGNLRAGDWSFVTGFDAQGQPIWGSVGEATPVLGVLHRDSTVGRLGWTTVEWAAPIQKYILTEWYYPNPRAECPGDPGGSCQSTSRWVMYQGDHVWGPWQSFGPEFTWAPGNPSSETNGDYFPVVPTRFMDSQIDTTVFPYQWHAWVLTTGNYWDPDLYHLTAVPLTLELIPTPPKDPAGSIKVLTAESAGSAGSLA